MSSPRFIDAERRRPEQMAALRIRMSPAERDALTRAAAAKGIPVRSLVLDALAPYLPKERSA